MRRQLEGAQAQLTERFALVHANIRRSTLAVDGPSAVLARRVRPRLTS